MFEKAIYEVATNLNVYLWVYSKKLLENEILKHDIFKKWQLIKGNVYLIYLLYMQ